MQKILIFLATIYTISSFGSAFAMGGETLILKPSLQAQIQKQEQVNKKAEALKRIADKKTIKTGVPKIVHTQTKNLTPVLTIPPVPPVIVSQVAEVKKNKVQESDIPWVDIEKVRNTWLEWTNWVRWELGLSDYTIDNRLNITATEWSDFSKERGYIIHGRPWDGCVWEGNYGCYNFQAIDTWFKARGIDPVVKNKTKHTENIGYGSYRCSSGDCTDEMLSAIRTTFDFYLREKSYNWVHYKSLINPNLSKIWVGISVDTTKWVYYLTIHYITE